MEDNRWTPDVDVALFRALHGHKPVGLNKHWHMACIQQRLAQSSGASFTADDIWERLRGLYDLDALDESECLPFPVERQDFELPASLLPLSVSLASTDTSPSPTPVPLPALAGQKRPHASDTPSPTSSPHRSTKRKRM